MKVLMTMRAALALATTGGLEFGEDGEHLQEHSSRRRLISELPRPSAEAAK